MLAFFRLASTVRVRSCNYSSQEHNVNVLVDKVQQSNWLPLVRELVPKLERISAPEYYKKNPERARQEMKLAFAKIDEYYRVNKGKDLNFDRVYVNLDSDRQLFNCSTFCSNPIHRW